MTNPTEDFFGGGGAKSMSFGQLHDDTWKNRWRGGRITHIAPAKQQTHIQTGAPMFKKDGVTPKNELPITLACDGTGQNPNTNERRDPSDDGRRTVYVKGSLHYAIGTKLSEMGLRAPEVGGELYMRYTAIEKKEGQEFAQRVWDVLYFPPTAAQTAQFFGEEQGVPAGAVHIGTARTPIDPTGNSYLPPQSAPPAPSFQQPAQAPAPAAAANDPWGAPSAPQQAVATGNPYGSAPAPQAAPPAAPAQPDLWA